jgi:hypothetical protein
LIVLLAGISSVWADCRQLESLGNERAGASRAVHTHGHHSGDHRHSEDAAIHCPSIDEFLPTAGFSIPRESPEQLLLRFSADPLALMRPAAPHGLANGPPGRRFFSLHPAYLVFSSLRI